MDNKEKDVWDIIKDATGIDYKEAARKGEHENTPSDLFDGLFGWMFTITGATILSVLVLFGGLVLLFCSLGGAFPAGNLPGELVFSLALIALGVFLVTLVTKKSKKTTKH
jgi:hypothetical protein